MLKAHEPSIDHEGALRKTFHQTVNTGVVQWGDGSILRWTQPFSEQFPCMYNKLSASSIHKTLDKTRNEIKAIVVIDPYASLDGYR
jgi:hypothetical protein